jgi:curved DNA-binding protein CbpA
MRRQNQEALNTPFREARQPDRVCDAPECAEEALYRAPKSRDRLYDYYWFCLEHVREYNRSWNYFKGMDEDEIEAERRADTTWHRPGWIFGSIGGGGGFDTRADERVDDPFGFFDDGPEAQRQRREGRKNGARRRQMSEEERAFAAFDLEPPVSFAAVKARYKELAKRLHPDANGGDREAEEQLKVINQAYTTLKAFYTQPA